MSIAVSESTDKTAHIFQFFFFFLKKVLNRLLKISGLSTFPGFKSGPSEFLIEYPCFTSLNLP